MAAEPMEIEGKMMENGNGDGNSNGNDDANDDCSNFRGLASSEISPAKSFEMELERELCGLNQDEMAQMLWTFGTFFDN